MPTTVNSDKIPALAKEVLDHVKKQILVELPFLGGAMDELQEFPLEKDHDADLQEKKTITFATDGDYLVYDPKAILKRFQNEQAALARDYLHVLFHCVFGHMFVSTDTQVVERNCWDLACDIAVEAAISELFIRAGRAKRATLQEQFFDELRKRDVMLTAEKLYRWILDRNLPDERVIELCSSFYADDHTLWYITEEEKNTLYCIPANSTGSSASRRQEWQEISNSIRKNLEASKQPGDAAGLLIQNLCELTREKVDYTEFLRKFAVMGEIMKINDDEFDFIFYTFGLQIYNNMPLIEPLEYKEEKHIREFVIAIDTSGSVQGDEVQTFVQKTYNILMNTESYFSKVNVHIIQCDAEVQEHIKITSREEFENYLKNMQLRGFGGTDFRPVFSAVDELLRNKEFTNLRGLIYFTDGYGVFPERKPDYETAFVFVRDDYEIPGVPFWAMKVILQADEIKEI